MSRLSFILPVYDPELPVLEKCIDALLAQSIKEWDAVFVLDGEFPEAEKLIHKLFKKSANQYKVVAIEHGGACKARNEGFKHTESPYVVFFDSDSCIEPDAALMWVEKFDRCPDIGFIYSGYKFFNEQGAINGQPFDPWTLRVTNYISSCFPVRRELVGLWDEDLESLQDWDFWLSVTERGGKGHYIPGYAFSTAYPTPKSVSGKGCTKEVWLSRMDRVKAKHEIPARDVCVTSIENKMDAASLAKMIDADFHESPNNKPNHYKTIIQVGFSLNPGVVEIHSAVWGPEQKKVLFWTKEDIDEIYNAVSLKALDEYSKRLNVACFKQFVEDKRSQDIMKHAGFAVDICPMPLAAEDEIAPLPESPSFLVDASQQYGPSLNVVKRALTDVRIDIANGVQPIEKYTGLIHFYPDRTLGSSIKRMLYTGRHVISNVQSPFAGFLDDATNEEKFIVSIVERIRKIIKMGPNHKAAAYYRNALKVDKILEAIA